VQLTEEEGEVGEKIVEEREYAEKVESLREEVGKVHVRV
jgi:NTP pyrophosphatase (non-canonical NTP hydrolase)